MTRDHARFTRPVLTLLLALTLSSTLCQCSIYRKCIAFFKDNTSTGGDDSWHRGDVPGTPLTWEQFQVANQHKNLSQEVLRTRFRVADANADGLLTPNEIRDQRFKAERNKALRAE